VTRLWVLGGLLVALTLAGLGVLIEGKLGLDWIRAKTFFVVIAGVSAAAYLLAVRTVTHRPGSCPGGACPGLCHGGSRRAVWVVLLVAAALRLPLIVSPPYLSTDIYRYVWDGRVETAGINPYRYLPADPALAALRDDQIYPHIARADYARTIYPPAAQVVFAAVGVIWSSVTGVKVTMVGFETLAVVCLLRLLAAARLPGQRVLIYAWNPLPVWAFADNGHVDGLAIGLLAVALLLRVRRSDAWAGVALGLAAATKFLPVVVAPALWRPRFGWRTAIAAIATLAALYALYSGAGAGVFGFLDGYGAEEGYDTGEGFWLLAGLSRMMALPEWAPIAYEAAAAGVLVAFGAWFAFRRRPDDPVAICGAAGVMMALLLFAISPHYPWYFASLALPCVLAPTPAVLWMATAPILLYLDTFGDRFVWPSVVYVPAIALACARLRPTLTVEPIKEIP
jgi:hypothetical protein